MNATTLEIRPMRLTIEDTPALSSDDHLVSAAQRNQDHFAALYNKYFEAVARFVYQRTATKDEALDITQQVFIQAMTSIHKYESRGFPFSSWLYRIALNEVNSRYRKSKNQRTINIDDTSLHTVMTEIDDTATMEKEERLLLALQELDEEEVQLLEMRFFEKRPFKEIAGIRDSNESAVKMKVYRLLDKLKTIMQKK